MAKTLTSKLILLVLGIGLLSQWLHLSELVAHSERVTAATTTSKAQRAPAAQASLAADDCSSPTSHEGTDQDHDEDCALSCHSHCHSSCRPAMLAATQLDHALSILHSGVSSENTLISDPHYGSLLRPPTA
ncbi:MAG: hypothetical protein JST16_14610 [Bdellovibrionales bacterium]|nr:hypothetical protein [Bdellovibrionales bacterium]